MAVHMSNRSRFRLGSFKKRRRSTSRKAQLVPPSIGTPRHTCSTCSLCRVHSNSRLATVKHLYCVQVRYCWLPIQPAQVTVGDSSTISPGGVFTFSCGYPLKAISVLINYHNRRYLWSQQNHQG